jgi:hypothetical protein
MGGGQSVPGHSTPQRHNKPPALLITHHDTHPALTQIALSGLIIALILAIVGLPSLDLHGPLHYLGVMDPLCGGTRSVYLTMHGRLLDAVRYNPAGPPLLAAAIAVLIRAAVGWSTRTWVDVQVRRRIFIPFAAISLVALEVNQQFHAALLTQPWGPAQ